MSQVLDLINEIYEENYSHFDFIFNMNGGDCDCHLHQTVAQLAIEGEE